MQARPTLSILLVIVLSGCAPVVSTAAPTAGSTDLRVTGSALPPGRYRSTGFELQISIELDGTWEAVNLLPGYFDLGHVPDVDELTLVQFAVADGLFERADSNTARPVAAADATAVIQANPSLRVVETSASRIGGLDGNQVTVETDTESSDAPLLMSPSGPVVVETGRRVWIAFFDTPKGLLAIMVSGSTAKWDAALRAAEPVLESITFSQE